MSTYHGAPPSLGVPRPAPTRPVTVALSMWGGLTVALLSLLGAVFAIVTGRDALRDYALAEARDYLGADADPELLDIALQAALDDAYSTLVIKAGLAAVVALGVLVFAFTVRNAALWARICLTVALVFNMCGGSGLLLIDTEVMPGLTVATAAAAPTLSIAVIVLMFLPPTNRYAAARKLAR
ncbi:hypothetical protein GCM10009557_65250 [Virgisporangium ochraceum]|uniref:Uncharacterized protein n=1 Tax=Virgisporangium ochraceum TaxID=65505 RepID=A0A8J4EDE1_9ACTN|nr:hypothetical protein [Virgisporangium ochraceum]GIJ67857.1 hypothetical protein Voc01_027740 [Virgisporangium ochraceum]